MKAWYEASTAGSNFEYENVKVKGVTLCCTGHLDTNYLFFNKNNYQEKSEGLCGIMGGSITYQIFNRSKVLKPCWYGCCFQSYETIYDITELILKSMIVQRE